MKPESYFAFIKEVGLPTAFSIFLLVALVYVVKHLVKEHKEERQRWYDQTEKTGEKMANSNENLASALNELRVIIKARNND